MTDDAPTARAPYLFPRLEERLLLLKHLTEFSPLPILVTAPAGGGKTTLCGHLVAGAAEPHWQPVALRGHPGLTREAVLSALESGLDLAAGSADAAMEPARVAALRQRIEYLIHTRELPLAVVDDADDMPAEALRCLAELSRAAGLRLVLAGSREITLPEVEAAPADGGFPHRIELPPLGPADLDGFEAHLAEHLGRDALPLDGAEAAELVLSSTGNPGQLATLLRQRSHGKPRAGQLARLRRAPRLGRIALPLAMFGALVAVAVGVNLLLPGHPGPDDLAVAPPTRLPPPHADAARSGPPAERPARAAGPDGTSPDDADPPAPMPARPRPEDAHTLARAPDAAPAEPPDRAGTPPSREPGNDSDTSSSAAAVGDAPSAAGGDRRVPATKPGAAAIASGDADSGTDPGTAHASDGAPGAAAPAPPRAGAAEPEPAATAPAAAGPGTPPPAADSAAPGGRTASPSPPERAARPAGTEAAAPGAARPALTSTPRGSAPSATAPGAFAVQVIGSRDKSAVYEFVEGLDVGLPRFVARTVHQGDPWYIGLIGAFDRRDAALASLYNLPESLKKRRPWVKDMRGLEAARIDPIAPR